MDLRGLQQEVDRFVEAHQMEAAPDARLLDLVSEVGELAKEVLGGTRYGRAQFQPADTWTEELGDAFFSLLCLANSTGVDMETALSRVLRKYERRLRSAGDAGSGR